MRTAQVLGVAAMLLTQRIAGQQPFALDTGFRAEFDTWYVASALPLEDGRVIISGQVKFDGDIYFRSGVRLESDGTRDETYPDVAYMGGKLTRWNDRIYSGNGPGVRRQLLDGTLDPDFILMNNGPYFTSLQGGDYHVFPDGRVVMSGLHMLNDPVRGFVGDYNFIWFSNQGYLDTTRTHRTGNGALYDFIELPDGKFIADYNGTVYDGRPTSGIQRMHADGSLDTTFWTGMNWGAANDLLALPDGRVYAGGYFRFAGFPDDTLRVARFLTDGSRDQAFQAPQFSLGALPNAGDLGPLIRKLYMLPGGALVVMGQFQFVDGQPRRGICALDSTGALLPVFENAGISPYVYQGFTQASVEGMAPSADGDHWYIWGAYHQYSDGTTNDTAQRFVTRLHGGDVNIGPQETIDPASAARLSEPSEHARDH
ncbi:MAG: delta-60 repeat domain-containing protein [Flavobacteriales bacterium]|nr:delta-60 repeat domain-containing protein [Flavobacteriales bacterium]